MMSDDIRYLAFDVFGTVVDWRASVIGEVERAGRAHGVRLDAAAFVDAWKSCYRAGMDAVNRGEEPWTNVDVIYRRKLDELLEAHGLGDLDEAARDELNRAWTRLAPWPDTVEGLERLKRKYVLSTLSNGNFAWLVEMAKHAGLPWDCVLTAENARRYKPDPAVYRMAVELLGGDASRIMMVAAHNYDLRHARSHGMRTAFVARPTEYGPGQTTDLSPEEDWDVVADDLVALAERLDAEASGAIEKRHTVAGTHRQTCHGGAGTMGKEEIEAAVAAHPYWYHRIELPHGVVTPGWAPVKPATYGVPADLSGRRVLDVGAWDGYWCFEALRRGAREVVAIDDFSDHLGVLENGQRRAWETFDLCRELLGYDEDCCRRYEMDVYDVAEETLGRFDLVLCFGVLYHMRHPLLALDRLAAVCDGEILVESAILDDFSPYRGGFGHGYPGRQVVMEFYPGDQYGGNETNWWVPTLHCLGAMVYAAGFPHLRGWKLADGPTELAQCRGFVHGRKA